MFEEVLKEKKKVLIATLYSHEPVMLAITKLSADKVILLVDREITEKQKKSLETIKNAFGKGLDIKADKTHVYDIVEVASKCVKLIDEQDKDDLIYINITSGRKTKAIGLLFAAYARHDHVKKIAYNPEEGDRVIYLPKLSFKLTESQKKILETVEKNEYKSIVDLADKIELSTAMLYRAIDELRDMDMISIKNGLALTDAGKIARL